MIAAHTPCSLQVGEEPASVYREYAPSPELRAHVICTWTLEIGAGDRQHRQRVLADGCSDIVWIGDSSPIALGPMTQPAFAATKAGTRLMGVRFRPEAAAGVLGVAPHELADRRIRLDELWSRDAVDEATERVWKQRTTAGRIAIVQRLISSRREKIGAPDAVVQHAISRLTRARNTGVDGLARHLGISERHLRRRFVASVGYSPRMFHRIIRFQRLLVLANAYRPTRLDILALHAGYADQAHMTREVGEFAGVPPSALLGRVESALSLSDLLEETI